MLCTETSQENCHDRYCAVILYPYHPDRDMSMTNHPLNPDNQGKRDKFL